MTTFVIIVVVIIAVLAVSFVIGAVIGICEESDRQREVARIARERRVAQARINRLTAAAIQQMTEAAQRERGGQR